MRSSLASTYALHALAYLAQQPPGDPVASYLIAEARDIPENLVAYVLAPLVTAGVLCASKGRGGDYWLARPTKDVTLLEVVEAVAGPTPVAMRIDEWGGAQGYNAYAALSYLEGPMPTYRVSKRNPDATTQAEAPVDAPSPYAAALEIAQRLNVHRGSIIYLLEAGPHAALTIGTEVYVFEVDRPAAPAA